MGSNFMAYIERLELMAFFSGYPLIYALILVIAGNKKNTSGAFTEKLKTLLPYAYAFTGILFLGLMLKNMYPDYSLNNFTAWFQNSWLRVWGLLSIFFFIPVLAKKPVLSLLHSLVFIFFLIKDLLVRNTDAASADVIKNDMKIYTDSLIVNVISLATVTIIYYLLKMARKQKTRTR